MMYQPEGEGYFAITEGGIVIPESHYVAPRTTERVEESPIRTRS